MGARLQSFDFKSHASVERDGVVVVLVDFQFDARQSAAARSVERSGQHSPADPVAAPVCEQADEQGAAMAQIGLIVAADDGPADNIIAV